MKKQHKEITQAILSTWLFISFLYYLIAKALPNFLNALKFSNGIPLSPIINLCVILTIGIITYFFGEWAYESWKSLIKKDL